VRTARPALRSLPGLRRGMPTLRAGLPGTPGRPESFRVGKEPRSPRVESAASYIRQLTQPRIASALGGKSSAGRPDSAPTPFETRQVSIQLSTALNLSSVRHSQPSMSGSPEHGQHLARLVHALGIAFSMTWQGTWSLILGFPCPRLSPAIGDLVRRVGPGFARFSQTVGRMSGRILRMERRWKLTNSGHDPEGSRR
jgi:hypothetical protein